MRWLAMDRHIGRVVRMMCLEVSDGEFELVTAYKTLGCVYVKAVGDAQSMSGVWL